MRLSRSQLVLTFVGLLLLRITVGYHFFKEGTNKLKYGFDASGFLSSAKGPFAEQFHSMVDDVDGKRRLGIVKDESKQGIGSITIDSQPTADLWTEFRDRAEAVYRFGDPELVAKLQAQRAEMAEQIKAARAEGDSQKAKQLETERGQAEVKVLQIRNQLDRSEEILADAIDGFETWLGYNNGDIIAHYGTEFREEGFVRDGKHREEAALYVDSLRYQVDTIKSDRYKKRLGWYSDVESMWDAYEGQINALATEEQIKNAGGPLTIFRHFDQPYSPLKLINKIIPWFDTIVGVLLILGLFTRFASGAAALFLVSVILTQPPWIPGTAPTYFYCIELAALLLLFASCAGRFGGLDFFLVGSPKEKKAVEKTQPQVASQLA